MDGNHIYAINRQQEICKIDLQDSKIVMKRKIEELSDPQKVTSSHIQQLTPWTFVIGSVINHDGSAENFKPHLHLVNGDISDPEERLRITAFEIPLFEKFDSEKPVVFRSLYIKER